MAMAVHLGGHLDGESPLKLWHRDLNFCDRDATTQGEIVAQVHTPCMSIAMHVGYFVTFCDRHQFAATLHHRRIHVRVLWH